MNCLYKKNFSPVSLAERLFLLRFSAKILEAINLDEVKPFKKNFFPYLNKNYQDLVNILNDKANLQKKSATFRQGDKGFCALIVNGGQRLFKVAVHSLLKDDTGW